MPTTSISTAGWSHFDRDMALMAQMNVFFIFMILSLLKFVEYWFVDAAHVASAKLPHCLFRQEAGFTRAQWPGRDGCRAKPLKENGTAAGVIRSRRGRRSNQPQGGRSETAVRRAQTHLRREDPGTTLGVPVQRILQDGEESVGRYRDHAKDSNDPGSGSAVDG